MKLNNMITNKHKQLLQQAWWHGVKAVNGYDLVQAEIRANNYSKITHVLAIGKAASAMILGAYDNLKLFKGLCITKHGHADTQLRQTASIETIESSHPVPDENSLFAGYKALKLIESLGPQDDLLVLVSGGASALAELLPDGVSLADSQQLNEKMLSENKTIHEINKARSEVSQIKYGKLLNQCHASSITSLAVSDVQGDDIRVIGSGIGACDLDNFNSKIIGSNLVARNAVADFFVTRGIKVVCNQESLYGDVFERAKKISVKLIEGEMGAYIFGGEPTIELPDSPGKGGRNQSLALALAKKISQQSDVVAIVAGSDGTDGPTEAAGGLIDANTFTKLDGAENALKQANAGAYLGQANALFVSGPTGTNVMDLVIALKLKQ